MHNHQSPDRNNEMKPKTRMERGADIIRGYLENLSSAPGVYRMLGENGDVLYVGKAKNLKKRVSNYTQPLRNPIRIQRMIAETMTMEFITTHTEVEALLLEANLIKKLEPRYNVLLRDDKSFPEILIRSQHDYPQIVKHRGNRSEKGDYFGPFASAGSVNRTITALQRAFLLRPCSDNIFSNRTRPCLQYQIKRCSAPCVDRISHDDYQGRVEAARAFLTGQSGKVRDALVHNMQSASDALDFEKAAELRDRIKALTQIQSHQGINMDGIMDADVIALWSEGGRSCIQVFFFRGGRNNGNKAYFPSHDAGEEERDILAAFIGQFYDGRAIPPTLLTNIPPSETELLEEALSINGGRKIRIETPQRGDKRKGTGLAEQNARDALARRMAERGSQRKLLDDLGKVIALEAPINRVEVYDNSHIQGASAIGAMIVAGPEGFIKQAYRKFNIQNKAAARSGFGGDDFAMMHEVLTRRFHRALKEDPDRESNQWPDLVIVDGGLGQLNVAVEVFEELGIDDIALMGIAKGLERNAGREKIFLPEKAPFMLDPKDPVLYFLQRMRDESHRFAIGSHRQKRSKNLIKNPLDEVAGIGSKRKKSLMLHFGSAKAVAQAGLDDLQAVDGISKSVAQKIYDHFHTHH